MLDIGAVGLDDVDRRIIEELRANGRITNADLASRVGLSASPCLRRVRRLEADGVIRKYTALVDPQALGEQLMIFVRVRLERQTRASIDEFETKIATMDRVLECYCMIGDLDYLLRIVAPDLETYRHWYMEHLSSIPAVGTIESQVVLNTVRQPWDGPLT